MKHHGVPLSLLSAFPTGHDITCEEFEGALRDITKWSLGTRGFFSSVADRNTSLRGNCTK